MTTFVSASLIQTSLNSLRVDVDFRILYDLGELPDQLKKGKDIDILVRPEDVSACVSSLKKQNFKEVIHPNIADIYIYNAPRRRMFVKQGLYIDIHQKLVVRSLDAGQWLPLDIEIQYASWADPHSPEDAVSFLPAAVEFCYLIVRCIFEKKNFPMAQRERISKLSSLIDDAAKHTLLSKVFFAFTPVLISLIAAERWEDIIPSYLEFGNY